MTDSSPSRNDESAFLEQAQALGMMSDQDLADEVKRNGSVVVERYIAALKWSEHATEHEKALVAGNLRTFWTWLHVNSRGRIKAALSETVPTKDVLTPVSARRPIEQVIKDAEGAIELFLEYRDKHGHDEDSAKIQAVGEFIEAESYEAPVSHVDPQYDILALDKHGSPLSANEIKAALSSKVPQPEDRSNMFRAWRQQEAEAAAPLTLYSAVQEIIDRSSHCMVEDGAGNWHDAVKAKISDLRKLAPFAPSAIDATLPLAQVRTALAWCINHSGECLGDHPMMLKQAKAAMAATDGGGA